MKLVTGVCNMLTSRQQAACTGRRRFLRYGCAAAGMVMCRPLLAKPAADGERRLNFHNTHTGENLSTVYWAQGQFISTALEDFDRLMRDHRTGDIHPIDTGLLDLLFVLHNKLESTRPFQIISGYRSPLTNAMLHQHSNGVSGRSYHMQGRAIDIRLGDRDLQQLHKAALAEHAGGVGYYPRSDFIHVDTGPLRHW